ncbi:unnamed protein product [Candida verbasci]|uniref:Ubiquitin carboxyl-terminal hydrolase n=1 Tax=Candida verbasci TaxID=1227364 RepID=A0A9W4TU16_9ASCO|nr:unnamed protein product [Candida verbasci]
MTSTLLNKSDLDKICIKLVKEISSASTTFSSLMSIQINLLQLFKNQMQIYKKYNYCDYEICYVLYITSVRLLQYTKSLTKSKNEDMYSQFKQTLSSKSNDFKIIESNLNLPHQYQERIGPKELLKLMKSSRVLLIDYRTRNSHSHNHIKFDNVINLQPKDIEALPNNATCQEIERLLDENELAIFKQRVYFEYIIVYDYKTGSGDKFNDILSNIDQINDRFQHLTTILMNNSNIKLYPIILSGGVLKWHDTFGDSSIESGNKPKIETKKETKKETETQHESSKYVTRFSDILNGNGVSKSNSQPKLVESNYIKPVVQGITPYDPTANKPSPKPIEKQLTPPISKPPLKPIEKLTTSSKSPSPITSQTTISSKKSNLLGGFTTGLTNLGNSCYMNSVIQCLAASPQLTSFFFPTVTESFSNHNYKQHINPNNKLGSKGKLTTSFVELLLNMFNNNGSSFSPSKFKRIMGGLSPNKQFITYDQQDCVEFLNFLLDSLHEDLNQVNLTPEEKKMITELTPEQEKGREILPIRLASTIEWERYLKLNFSIMVDYFQGQLLSQLKCLNCKFTSTTYNSFSILSLPIPEKLNRNKEVSLYDCIDEFVSTENQSPPFKYRLFGVANHFGNLTTGHYTSYVYKQSKSQWCYFDDSKITYNVSSSKILNKNAYCLFFQRI